MCCPQAPPSRFRAIVRRRAPPPPPAVLRRPLRIRIIYFHEQYRNFVSSRLENYPSSHLAFLETVADYAFIRVGLQETLIKLIKILKPWPLLVVSLREFLPRGSSIRVVNFNNFIFRNASGQRFHFFNRRRSRSADRLRD